MTCLHAIQPPEMMYSQHNLVIFTASETVPVYVNQLFQLSMYNAVLITEHSSKGSGHPQAACYTSGNQSIPPCHTQGHLDAHISLLWAGLSPHVCDMGRWGRGPKAAPTDKITDACKLRV